MPTATAADAQIVLQLYELRREPEMRKARNWMNGFSPESSDEIVTLAQAFGTQENAWMRQVLTYWETAAALVYNGAVDKQLFFDTQGEMWFVFAKFHRFLAEFRAKLNAPEAFTRMESVITGSPEGRERLARVEDRIEKMKARLKGAAATK